MGTSYTPLTETTYTGDAKGSAAVFILFFNLFTSARRILEPSSSGPASWSPDHPAPVPVCEARFLFLAVAASAESFDNCHSSSTVSGPGANSLLFLLPEGKLFYIVGLHNKPANQITSIIPWTKGIDYTKKSRESPGFSAIILSSRRTADRRTRCFIPPSDRKRSGTMSAVHRAGYCRSHRS